MLILFDIGNTHTHVGLATTRRVVRTGNFPSDRWAAPGQKRALRSFLGRGSIEGAALCSVVPALTPLVIDWAVGAGAGRPFVLTARTVSGLGIDYPRPQTIGPDRLANAIAARHFFGAPVVVVDFGTAVTFDVVNRRGQYAGGIIAPGLAVMTEYLHEKTALLPKIKIREVSKVIGKNTEQAMLIGAVHGYRGLVRELIKELKLELNAARLPVIGTGGYAALMAAGLPEITHVNSKLTLEGLRLAWLGSRSPAGT
jgi:type III pantothenate kinase